MGQKNMMRVVSALRRNRGVRWSLVVVVAFFLIFEVTVRHLPPDGVTVTTIDHYAVYNPGAYYFVKTTSRATTADTVQTRAKIDTLNNAFAAAPFSMSPYLARPCMTVGGWVDYQVTFTWHGLPVQSWTSLGGCGTFTENSGGIPNVLWGHWLPVDGQNALHVLQ